MWINLCVHGILEGADEEIGHAECHAWLAANMFVLNVHSLCRTAAGSDAEGGLEDSMREG